MSIYNYYDAIADNCLKANGTIMFKIDTCIRGYHAYGTI